jgi:hypothetical protein
MKYIDQAKGLLKDIEDAEKPTRGFVDLSLMDAQTCAFISLAESAERMVMIEVDRIESQTEIAVRIADALERLATIQEATNGERIAAALEKIAEYADAHNYTNRMRKSTEP